MTYDVVVQRRAVADLKEAYDLAARYAPDTAARWLDRFQAALRTLDQFPERCGFARENGKVEVEVREFLFGKKPYVFRAIFAIDGSVVRVLRVRRAQRQPLTRQKIEEALESDD